MEIIKNLKVHGENTAKTSSPRVRIFRALVIALLVVWASANAEAQTCATPGKDGPGGVLANTVNTYYPGQNASRTANSSTTISLGTATGSTTPITNGDLLMVMQMQDTEINSLNTVDYGDGAGGNAGAGYINPGTSSTGRYEFIRATNAIGLGGGNLTFQGTSPLGRLNFSYFNVNATGTRGQRRFQVIRVPQYTTATLGNSLTALPWNGTTGGVLSIDVAGVLTLGSATVSVNGRGFRPGAGRQLTGGSGGANTDYRNVAGNNYHGQKGEGIAGTPQYMYITSTDTILNTGVEGYPNGSTGRGAPGNAGGGGSDGRPSVNDQNSGGGGGANGGAGGLGGRAWNSGVVSGGIGGAVFGQVAASRLVIGGGGGGGSRNNTPGVNAAASGAAGGGMVFVRAGSITGTGTLSANGADAFNDTLNDGGGGGGAGGSVLFWVKIGNVTGLTVNARGGRGGDAWRTQAPGAGLLGERHGPGGGGSGGVVFLSSAATSVSVTGGLNGITTTANDPYGATPGADGIQNTGLFASQIPGIAGGATCTLLPSAVELESFDATRFPNYVVLQWQSAHEADNLGFNIYREENGQRQQINKSLIAGSALVTAPGALLTGTSYSWTDRSPSGMAHYWLEDVDLDGTTTLHGPIAAINAPYDQHEPLHQVRDSQAIEMVGTESSRLDLSAPVSRKAKRAKVTPELLFAQSDVAGHVAAKISVKQEGWYRVTEAELVAAGFKVTSPQHLQLFADGNEQPFILKSEKGGNFTIEFYGVGIDTTWTDSRVYWLVNGTRPGVKTSSVQEDGLGKAGSSFQYTVERSDRNIYFSAVKNGEEDNFFGAIVASAGAAQTITLRNVDPASAGAASVEVRLQGATTAPHQVRVLLNQVTLGDVVFTGRDQGLATFTLPQASLKEGENQVMLSSLLGSTDVSLLVSIRVTYWHSYKADNGGLRFTANGKEEVTIEGFNSEDVRVVDVTRPNTPLEVVGSVKQLESGYSITVVAPGDGERTLLAFSPDSVKRPAGIRADQPSTLRQKGKGADLVIVTTQSLKDSLEPLKALRQRQKMSVLVVDVEDIYDEFSFGHKTPQSIKDFLSYARTNWSPAPRFLLLVGDATYDPRNYLGQGYNDLVPTKLVGTVQMETASDDWYADFDGDDLPELAVGRFPVKTVAEADAVVAKIVAYDQQQPSNSALLVNDRNTSFDFQNASKTVKSLIQLPSIVEVDRVQMDDATAKNTIMQNLNLGPKIVNYIGHGSLTIWAGNMITGPDALSLTNKDQLSLFVLQTCLNGYFIEPTTDTLAEKLMKNPQGGAVAVWASTGYTEADGQVKIDQELMKNLFSGKFATIGEAIMQAKGATGDTDVRRTWTFFGDPSMKLR